MAPMTASIENGKNHDMVAILDAGAQYGKVKKKFKCCYFIEPSEFLKKTLLIYFRSLIVE